MEPANDDTTTATSLVTVEDLLEPNRRVFSVYDGAGEGDGTPCGQLSPVPAV